MFFPLIRSPVYDVYNTLYTFIIFLLYIHIYTYIVGGRPTAHALSENNTSGFLTLPTINKHNAARTDNYCGKNFSITARTGLE